MRRRKPRVDAGEGKRRLKRIQRDLCTTVGLDPRNLSDIDHIRIETAAFAMLARDTLQARALAGAPIDIGELERVVAAIKSILPEKAKVLTVAFVDHSDVCILCKAPLPPVEEREPVAPAKIEPPSPSI